MITATRRGICLAFVLGLTLPCVTFATSHEGESAKAWDAAAVGRQLDRLAVETTKVKNGLARHLEGTDETSPRRIVIEDVFDIHHRVISLRMGIRNGLNRDQTEPVFRRLMSSVAAAQADAANFPEIEEVRPSIDAARAILTDLEAYYGA